MKSKILVTGGGGYVGSRLVPSLLEDGYQVNVLDTFWFGPNVFGLHISNPNLKIFKGDIRNTKDIISAIEGCQSVIHLACISNDPSYDLDPKLGKSINFDSFIPFIDVCNKNKIERFIYASSSSVYGIKQEENVTESLDLNPLTDYSKYKAECENILLENSSNNFVSTILRPATVCGFSLRQRFDLVVNILAYSAHYKNEIRILGGSQFRPNINIIDMIDAYKVILKTPKSIIQNKIYNVGSKNETVAELGYIVREVFDNKPSIKIEESSDLRSYRIDSGLIKKEIGFETKFSVRDAVIELRNVLEQGLFDNNPSDEIYSNIKLMQKIKVN
jgi:nucleoside-diphosphate-sugar epimerase